MEKIKFRYALIFGTRPEAIKMAPVYLSAREHHEIETDLIFTGQQPEMVMPILRLFNISADYNLGVKSRKQDLVDLEIKLLKALQKHFRCHKYDLVLVQGDTISSFSGALAAFYGQIPVAHIEAGLRSFDLGHPFPEEGLRRMIDNLSDIHFPPTKRAKGNLADIGVRDTTYITGNTGIDALMIVSNQNTSPSNKIIQKIDFSYSKYILFTMHRRENLGQSMIKIFNVINKITKEFKDIKFIFPVHPNPKIRNLVNSILKGNDSVMLVEPLCYHDMVYLLSRCWVIMTDSGGIQEEAPTFGVPVLILRRTTERQEILESGSGVLVGLDSGRIFNQVKRLYEDRIYYNSFKGKPNPYGDGNASRKILDHTINFLNKKLK